MMMMMMTLRTIDDDKEEAVHRNRAISFNGPDLQHHRLTNTFT